MQMKNKRKNKKNQMKMVFTNKNPLGSQYEFTILRFWDFFTV